MVLNRGDFDRDYCVAGEDRMQELSPDQFRSRQPYQITNGRRYAKCPFCEQWTEIKKDDFFKRHKISIKGHRPSIKGHVPSRYFGPGEPARVKGRRQ